MIMAGGTGGHVFPALALATALRDAACEVVWLGTRRGIEARLVPAAGIPVEWIAIGGLRGKGLVTLLAAPFALLRALWQSLRAMWRYRPAVVVGLGGYVTGPGGIAARLAGRPLVIHEQNAIAGFTNRVLARFATRVFEGFGGAFAARIASKPAGNPVRREFFELPEPARRYASHTGPLRLLVIGGSQGAARLNALLPQALAKLSGVIVRHQCGEKNLAATRSAYLAAGIDLEAGDAASITVSAFIDDIAAAYGWADLVVCRAGALTVAEIAAAGVAAVLVPFPAAVDDHQTANARFLVDRGAARLLDERGLDAETLARELGGLLADRNTLCAMALKARELARPSATRDLAAECLAVGGLA